MTDHLIQPPHSIEAEEAVIGGMLIDPNAVSEVADLVEAGDFYRHANRVIFRAIAQMDEGGECADVVTVSEALSRDGLLDDAGGLEYLGQLAKGTPGTANIRAYASVVAGKARRRELMGAATEIQRLALEADDPVGQAQQLVMDIGTGKTAGPVPVHEISARCIERLDQRSQGGGEIVGLSTGFYDFDAKTSGLQDGSLIVIAGRPSMGKTTLAMNIAEHQAVS